MVHVVWYAGL